MRTNDESSFSYKNPEDSPGYILGRVSAVWQQAIKSRLDPLNISPSCFSILAAILWHEERGDEIRQGCLVTLTKLDKMTVSKTIRSIEGTGFITRTEDPNDARAKKIRLTVKGRKIAKKAVKTVEAEDEKFFSGLPKKQQGLLKSMMKSLIETAT